MDMVYVTITNFDVFYDVQNALMEIAYTTSMMYNPWIELLCLMFFAQSSYNISGQMFLCAQ